MKFLETKQFVIVKNLSNINMAFCFIEADSIVLEWWNLLH